MQLLGLGGAILTNKIFTLIALVVPPHERAVRVFRFIMKSFTQAFKEYLQLLTIDGMSPKIVWYKGKYIVTAYYSESTIKRLGGEVLHG